MSLFLDPFHESFQPRPAHPPCEIDTPFIPTTQGKKHDQGKLDWALLPITPTEEILKVLMHGAQLYGRENWKLVENAEQRYWNAAMRHLTAFQKGERLDPDTGLSHLAHAGCNILFLLELTKDA